MSDTPETDELNGRLDYALTDAYLLMTQHSLHDVCQLCQDCDCMDDRDFDSHDETTYHEKP